MPANRFWITPSSTAVAERAGTAEDRSGGFPRSRAVLQRAQQSVADRVGGGLQAGDQPAEITAPRDPPRRRVVRLTPICIQQNRGASGPFRHDADESTCYEYLCKRANIAVHDCAEPFVNDGRLLA